MTVVGRGGVVGAGGRWGRVTYTTSAGGSDLGPIDVTQFLEVVAAHAGLQLSRSVGCGYAGHWCTWHLGWGTPIAGTMYAVGWCSRRCGGGGGGGGRGGSRVSNAGFPSHRVRSVFNITNSACIAIGTVVSPIAVQSSIYARR